MSWSFESSPLLILLALVALGATGGLSWLQWRRRNRERPVAWIEGLRFLSVAFVLFTLFKPELVRIIPRIDPAEVVILLDASNSMQTRDVSIAGQPPQTREGWLTAARERKFWAPLETQGTVAVESFALPPIAGATGNAEEGTNLSAPLLAALKTRPNLKAVLVATDGDWNLGESPVTVAAEFAERNIPIYSIGIGVASALPDLELKPVTVPSFGLLGEQISVPFRIQSFMPREVKTEVKFTGAAGVDVRKTVTIPPFSQVQDSLIWSPTQPGDYTLKLSFPAESDESLTGNNEQDLRISIRNETLKVLVIDSAPRWEYRYLRNALERDPGIELKTLLFHPGMKLGGGTDYLDKFPESKEELSKYDVIFLGDIGNGPGELTNQQLELIRGLVEHQGSGLVLLPGLRGRLPSLQTGPLGDLFPVELDTGNPQGAGQANESHLTLTGEGAGHLLTRLAADEASNAALWRNLPGFYWTAPVRKSRPGASVLAVHETQRNEFGRLPLLATRDFGNGKVLFLGTDGAWRWRKGVEDRYHYRFWAQVVRWMAHQRHLAGNAGIRLSFAPENPRQGDTIYLLATVFDANGFPIESGRVMADVASPKGKRERLEFTPVSEGWGVFKSSFVPAEAGVFKLAVSSGEQQIETELLVSQVNRERLGQPANLSILQEISSLTSGAFGSPAEIDHIVRQISLLPEPKPLEIRLRIWSEWWWGAILLTLLGAYWVSRKVYGMV